MAKVINSTQYRDNCSFYLEKGEKRSKKEGMGDLNPGRIGSESLIVTHML